jgi:hypothetical protein
MPREGQLSLRRCSFPAQLGSPSIGRSRSSSLSRGTSQAARTSPQHLAIVLRAALPLVGVSFEGRRAQPSHPQGVRGERGRRSASIVRRRRREVVTHGGLRRGAGATHASPTRGGGVDDDVQVLRMGGGAGGAGPDPANVRVHSRPRAALVRVPLGDLTRAQTPQRTEMVKAQGIVSPMVGER